MATFSPEAYTVGWFCVLRVEVQAAKAMLDEEHNPPNTPYDENSYFLGRMGEHNVVIVGVVVKGRASLAEAAVNMIRTFTQIRFGLKVGIAGGAVNATDPRGFPNDILLGDVVISRPDGGHGKCHALVDCSSQADINGHSDVSQAGSCSMTRARNTPADTRSSRI